MLLANETVAGHLESKRHAGAVPHPRAAGSAEGPAVRRVHQRVRLFAGRAGRLGAAEAFPEAGREDQRHPGRAADRVPDAADDAEGAIRRDERRAFRPGRGDLYALHVADPPLSRPGRAPAAARVAAARRSRDERKAELDEDLPEVGRHTSEMERRAAEAEREILQWKKVRFMADKVGDVFDGYITGVAPFGMFVELIEHYVEGLVHVSTHGGRLLPVPRAVARRCSARTPRRPTGWATRCAFRSFASTWSGGRSISASKTCSRRSGATSARAGRRAARRDRRRTSAKARRSERRKRKQRLGKERTQGRSEEVQMANLVVGTAGHIDHGKSSLVQGA